MTTATTTEPDAVADSEVGTVPTDVTARQLFPVLSEYAGKLGGVTEKIIGWCDLQLDPRIRGSDRGVFEIARLIGLYDVYKRKTRPLSGTASGLLDHAKLDGLVEDELALRREELDEQLRFADLAVGEAVRILTANRLIDTVRQLIEKSGRYKSPV